MGKKKGTTEEKKEQKERLNNVKEKRSRRKKGASFSLVSPALMSLVDEWERIRKQQPTQEGAP